MFSTSSLVKLVGASAIVASLGLFGSAAFANGAKIAFIPKLTGVGFLEVGKRRRRDGQGNRRGGEI